MYDLLNNPAGKTEDEEYLKTFISQRQYDMKFGEFIDEILNSRDALN